MFVHATRCGAPEDHIRLASASSRTALLSGIQLVVALRHLSAMFRETVTLLLHANRRSPAYRSAIPRRHVVQSPSIRFSTVEKRHSAARQRCGTAEFPEITRSANDLSTEIQRQTKNGTGQKNTGKRGTAGRSSALPTTHPGLAVARKTKADFVCGRQTSVAFEPFREGAVDVAHTNRRASAGRAHFRQECGAGPPATISFSVS